MACEDEHIICAVESLFFLNKVSQHAPVVTVTENIPYLQHLHTVVYFFITGKINNVTLPSIVQNGTDAFMTVTSIEYSDDLNTVRSALSSF